MSVVSCSTTSTTAYKVTADTTGTLVLQTGATPTTAVTIDGSQNVGIGVAPSTWGASFKAAQITNSMSLWAAPSGSAYYSNNVSFDGTNRKYMFTGAASEYVQSNGAHYFNTAVSGSAGATITVTTPMVIDSSGKVGIGGASAGDLFQVSDTTGGLATFTSSSNGGGNIKLACTNVSTSMTGYIGANAFFSNVWALGTSTSTPVVVVSNGSERVRINTNGAVGIGSTSNGAGLTVANVGLNGWLMNTIAPVGTNYTHIVFTNSNGNVGSVTTNGSTTAFNTSSDYRLKHDVQQMTGALARIAALKPVTYKWNVDGSDGEGFIAHELAEVVPQCVTGEKDGVETYTDEEGNEQTRPVYQGIDTSFLVATLTAAIQELKAELDAAKADIATLKGAA